MAGHANMAAPVLKQVRSLLKFNNNIPGLCSLNNCFLRRKHLVSLAAYFTSTSYKRTQFHRCNNITYSKTSNVLTANDRRITRCLSDTRRAHEREPHVAAPDPYQLVRGDLHALYSDIQTELGTEHDELHQLANYYLIGEGKAFRPMIACLMATACNIHTGTSDSCLASQRCIAMIAEMIHAASLVHDDVIDRADKRRSKPSINKLWGQRKAVLTGDFILSQASIALARIGNEQVVILLSQVLEDLVKGEFMQLGTKENENQRFAHYLDKTYKKTASLIANSCRAVAVLSDAHEDVQEVSYQYGRNLGIAFQLVDDLLDFVSTEEVLGKPAASDLKLGLATAPVLFAAQQFPHLNELIMRRFDREGDVQEAWSCVDKSNGLEETRLLARQHCREAVKHVGSLAQSDARRALISITEQVLTRKK